MSQPIDIPGRNKKTPSPPPNPLNLPEGIYSLRHHVTVPTPRDIYRPWMNLRSRGGTTTSSATISSPQPPPQLSKRAPRKASSQADKWKLSNILQKMKEAEENQGTTRITAETGEKIEVEDEDVLTTEEEVEQDSTEVKEEVVKEGKATNQMD